MATATQMTEVHVPDIGDFSDVPIIEVMVSPGDTVAEEDPIVTLESDKATMDVPSPVAGVVQDVKVSVGDAVSEGALLLTVAPAGGGEEAAPSQPALAEPAAEEAASAPAAPAAAAPAAEAGEDTFASPGVRRLARELDIDVAQVTGSGRKGRVTKEDLKAFLARGADGAAPAGGGVGLDLIPWPKLDFSKLGETETVPLSRIKKISGANLWRNWVRIPHVTVSDEADITDLEAFRKATNAADKKGELRLTMLAFLIKASVAALKAFPEFNASLDGDNLILKRYYNIGFAADTPEGLVVPVIRGADAKGIVELANEMGELSAKARAGKLGPAEMSGGNFTISSLGGIGGTSFTPIINAPEVAILGVMRSAMRPVWDGSAFVPRLMLPLCLSFDHRVIDGAAAARFNRYLATALEDLRRVLL
jgi:pyruvate dehydrogenase E2 component (dihydrolipoamide acetyltransferase)